MVVVYRGNNYSDGVLIQFQYFIALRMTPKIEYVMRVETRY